MALTDFQVLNCKSVSKLFIDEVHIVLKKRNETFCSEFTLAFRISQSYATKVDFVT